MGGGMMGATNSIFGDAAQNNYSGGYDYAENNIVGNIGNENKLAQSIQQQAASGASPADIQAQQMSNQNLAQTQALIGSQRGINPGLATRQIAQAGANMNQQGQANMALQRAQEQIAANQQVGNIYGNIGNQLTGNQSTAAQGSLAQNKANAANEGAVWNAMSSVASMGQNMMSKGGVAGYDDGGSVNFNSNFGGENSGDPLDSPDGVKASSSGGGGGGGGGGIMSMLPMLAALYDGGKINYDDGGMTQPIDNREANFLALLQSLANQRAGSMSAPSFNVGEYKPVVDQAKQDEKGPKDPVSGGEQMAGGPDDSPGSIPVEQLMASQGGKVPALVSPGEKYIPPQEAKKVAKGEKSIKDAGKMIPGKAQVKGDSPKNDTIPANLDKGGIVIPRSVMNSDDPIKEGTKFLVNALKGESKEEKDFHGALKWASGGKV